MTECKRCKHPPSSGPADCNCECHAYPVHRYEPRQIMPAAPGWRAIFKADHGPGTVPVVMWAVCLKKAEWFLRNERPSQRKSRPERVIVGMVNSGDALGLEASEAIRNFVGYAEPGASDDDIKRRLDEP